jgi:hypothetical protein
MSRRIQSRSPIVQKEAVVPSYEFSDACQDLRVVKGVSIEFVRLAMADVDNGWKQARLKIRWLQLSIVSDSE